jgi:hypothetical protein
MDLLGRRSLIGVPSMYPKLTNRVHVNADMYPKTPNRVHVKPKITL